VHVLQVYKRWELKKMFHATVKDLLTTKRANGSISCSDVSRQLDGGGGDDEFHKSKK